MIKYTRKAIAVLSLALFLFAPMANAQESGGLPGGTKITPIIIEAGVDPGDERVEEISVTNLEGYNRTFSLKFLFADVNPSSGELGLIADATTEEAQNTLVSWMSLVDKKDIGVVLGPGKSHSFKVKVSVPQNAQPGAHYAMIQAIEGVVVPDTATGSGMGAALSTVIAYTVSGDVIEEGVIRSFTSDKRFYFNTDLGFDAVIENSGNAHFVPIGNIHIYDIFGKEVLSIPFNNTGRRTLPDSERAYSVDLKDSGLPLGRYTANLALSFGSAVKKSMVQDLSFFVLPWLQMIILFVVIIAIYFWMKQWRKKLEEKYAKSGKTLQKSSKKTMWLIAILVILLAITILRL